jgi:outer membrane protein assembly factor BamB
MRSILIAFATILTLGLRVPGAALEWPEFRGPTGQGISTATNVPITWNAAQNIAWKIETPAGWSSPILSNGKIFLTGSSNIQSGISLRALRIDAGSGKIDWDVEALRAGAPGQKHQKNGLASPTPIVRDGKLYVHFGHLGTAALDLNGKILWTQTSLQYPPVHGNGGSPVLVNDLLIFGCDGATDPFLVALDSKSGQVKWKTPRNSPARSQFSFATPLLAKIDGRDILVSPASGFVGGYDPKSGQELWRVGYGEGYSIIPRPVYAHGLLFVSSGYDRPVLYAINPAGARGDATAKAIVWSQAKAAPNTPSTLAVGDELYTVSDAGIATCFDAKTGAIHWNERLGGSFSASPVYAEGRLYFQNEEGVGYVLKAGKQFQLLSKNDLAERSLASPAVIDNAIILRTATHLWRISTKP